jgi:hypothetical protein
VADLTLMHVELLQFVRTHKSEADLGGLLDSAVLLGASDQPARYIDQSGSYGAPPAARSGRFASQRTAPTGGIATATVKGQP